MMSNLPKQVQLQAEEVAELDKMFEQPNEAEQPTAEVVQEPVERPSQPPKKTDDDTWQQRYQTLQGMYNADVPRLNTQVKELQQQLKDALAAIETVKKSSQVEAPAERLVTEKDVEAYGGELIDLVKRQASEVFQAERAQLQRDLLSLQAENADLRQQLGGVAEKQGMNDRRAYFMELAKEVPDYETLNTDPDFLAWLAEIDPLSGVSRQSYLNVAFEHFDVKRTANLFNAWKREAGKPEQPRKTAARELERQVAPGTSRGASAAPVSAGDKIWSMQEIERFYVEASKGKYARDDVARIEAEIDAAVAAGRVRQ
jgi:hypothetical protein